MKTQTQIQNPAGQDKPILVTGAHRSGTTWTSAMLNLAPETLMTEEPMNVMPHRYAFDGLATDYFTYAPELPEEKAIEAFQKIIDRRTGKVFSRKTPHRYFKWARQGRYIIKDPIACLSSDWLNKHFDLHVVVLVRHPCAFVTSLQRMGWNPDLSIFFNQPKLREDYLQDLLAMRDRKTLSFIEEAAITWKIIYRVLNDFSARHPEWIFVKHATLAANPLKEFKILYDRLGLEWTPAVEKGIEEHCSPKNRAEARKGSVHTLKRDSKSIVNSWKKKLTDQDISIIKELTYPEWTHWYKEKSWI